MKIKILLIYIIFYMLPPGATGQNYNFEIDQVIFSEKEQEVELQLKTSSFEALNFFNHSQEDFSVNLVDLQSKELLECSIQRFESDQLSEKGLKEWHIVLDAYDIDNPETVRAIRSIYNKIRSAKLPLNAFVNVYILGNKLMPVDSDFSNMPKFSEVVNLFDAVDKTRTNFVEISSIFNSNRKHIIALISIGEVGKNIRTEDKDKVEERFISKIEDFKDDVEIYPIMYQQNGNNDFLIRMVQATASLDDEMAIKGIRKLSRQKDGAFSNKDEFDFTIIAKPRQTKGNYFNLGNQNIQVICQYFNNKSGKRKAGYTNIVPSTPVKSTMLYPSDYEGSIWKGVIAGLSFLLIILLSLYLVIPIYNRYVFKKNHVFKYQDIKQAKRTRKDPLTMEEFGCDNDIVVFGEKMMLLETWKYMRNRDDIETAKDYGEFFQDNIEGNIFTHSNSPFNWAFLAFFSGLAALFLYLIYHITILFTSTKDVLALLEGLGMRASQSEYQTFLVSAFATLIGLGVFYFQNKLSDHSYWNIKDVWIPLTFGVMLVPLILLNLSSSVLGNGIIGDAVWSLLFATSMALAMRKFPVKEALKYVPSIISGSIMYLLLLQVFDVELLSAKLTTSFGMACTLGLGFGIQNQLLKLFDKEEKVKLLKIINPAGYSGTQLPLNVKVKKKWSIGNNPKNDIYIKWLDYDVRNDHCFIEFSKGTWTIYAYNGELFKNGVLISNGTELIIGDIIALGQNAITQFKFMEAASDDIDTSGYANTSGQADPLTYDASDIEGKKIDPIQNIPIQQRIKIKPRNI